MATAMGINPATQKYVPFDITNRSYAENLHDIMLKPLNSQGIGNFSEISMKSKRLLVVGLATI